MMSFGGASLYPWGGASTRRISEFDPVTRSWVIGRRAEVPGRGSMIGAHARLDPATNDVFFVPGQRASLTAVFAGRRSLARGWGEAYVRVHATGGDRPATPTRSS